MDNLELINNFEDIQLAARKIDNGIEYLEKKLSNVSNVGLSVNPERTKTKAQNILRDYQEEIEEMKSNIDSCTETEKEIFQECVEDNKKISKFLQDLKNELKTLESNLCSNRPNYQPYLNISSLESGNCSQLSDKKEKRKKLELNFSTINNIDVSNDRIQDVVDPNFHHETDLAATSLSNSTSLLENIEKKSSFMFTPLSVGSRRISKIQKNFKEISSLNLDKDTDISFLDIYNNSIMNKTNNDICKTPVDPGVSKATMQLLGKSNIKTKVYKKIHSNLE